MAVGVDVCRRLSDLLETGPIVLFFYPAAMTYGCTEESRQFRDLKIDFDAVGATRIGINADPVDKQLQVRAETRLRPSVTLRLDRAVAKAFGVKRRSNPLKVKRSTFVIDTDSSLIAQLHSKVSLDSHADKALEILRARQPRT